MPIDTSKYLIKYAKPSQALVRKFVTKLDKPGAMLPVILLETTVTAGRTYHAYKRDGYVEARERVTEESFGAVFWLFGAKMFGKLIDYAGKKMDPMLKKTGDVAQDEVRTPFKNLVSDLTKTPDLSALKPEMLKNKLARFAVGKTFASLITACLFIGLVVPKINQAITKHIYGKNKDKKNDDNVQNNKPQIKSHFGAPAVSINSVESFKANKNNGSKTPSFKSAASLTRIVQNFEENDVWKLMGTDVGTVTGRTANARNKDERIEIMFRDISSIYFYCFSMPAIIKFMNNKDSFGGLNTKLNPMSAAEVHNLLVRKMGGVGKEKMSVAEFREFALGTENYDKEFYNKVFSPELKQAADKAAGKSKVHYYTTTLEDFSAKVDAHVKDTNKAKSLKETAFHMSGMQPKKDGAGRILTESQVEDILRGGEVRKPAFMKRIINRIFSTKKNPGKLYDPYQYISQSNVEDRRKRIIDYVESIIKNAEKEGGEVTLENMLKMNKRNLRKNGLFMAVGMGVSALFLSTVIPKLQYLITKIRTGKDSFPGVENMEPKKAK